MASLRLKMLRAAPTARRSFRHLRGEAPRTKLTAAKTVAMTRMNSLLDSLKDRARSSRKIVVPQPLAPLNPAAMLSEVAARR